MGIAHRSHATFTDITELLPLIDNGPPSKCNEKSCM